MILDQQILLPVCALAIVAGVQRVVELPGSADEVRHRADQRA
jgi:hypothetical protein